MQRTRLRLPGSLLSALALATLALSCRSAPQRAGSLPPLGEAVPTYADWPAVRSELPREPAMEERIAALVAGMSLREKVGQMTQPEIKSITPDEVRRYYIGSVLNGGGTWPGGRKQSGARDWALLAEAYWQASMSTDSKVKIPIIWGTDAVHGHANIYGATLFPHNIGLGAAHDPDLVRRIAEVTAIQVAASGLDWSFSPVVAVVRDDRWGRTYESYSEHPALVRSYARAFVKGLQGEPGRPVRVVATAKHFIGDGGTHQGRDRGENRSSPAELINLHGQGYYTALEAGAQTVMASFNGWAHAPLGINEGKVHGSRLLLTEVLKQKLGFDGFVVSDWNGIEHVPGCTKTRCAQAINAGIDMVMVPEDWKQFIEDTVQIVERGEIPMARIDDAVTRILRVKMRMGLFQAPRPLERPGAGDESRLVHRELAREAVRKSLVLLKNNGNVLPLAPGRRLLVVGKSANSLSNQTGGWTLTWQGTDNTNADFPHGDTILAGIQEAAGDSNVTYSPRAEGVQVSDYSAVIAVVGETPYAEWFGDIGKEGTLELGRRFPEDLAVLEAVQGKGVPVITVLVTGRPLWVNKELNRSDAFVVAWLPGTEGKGVADLLFHKADFQGQLSFSWPKSACQATVNHGDVDYEPLFPLGYGLTYADRVTLGRLDETAPAAGCDQPVAPD